MKTILGIDPGTQCGWAIRSPGGAMLACGTWDLAGNRFEGGGMRYVRFVANLKKCHEAHCFDMVAYEEVRRHMGVDAAHIYGGIRAQLMAWCEGRDIPYQGIPVGTIKKAATGKGNAQKEAMVSAAMKQWPDRAAEIVDDNTADAMWIAEVAGRGLA